MWCPESEPATPDRDLLATTGDYLRIWNVSPQGPKLEALLNNNKNSEYCAPLTSLDWNQEEPSLLGTACIDTTCTIWDVNTQQAKTQIIAHDKEVYDIGKLVPRACLPACLPACLSTCLPAGPEVATATAAALALSLLAFCPTLHVVLSLQLIQFTHHPHYHHHQTQPSPAGRTCLRPWAPTARCACSTSAPSSTPPSSTRWARFPLNPSIDRSILSSFVCSSFVCVYVYVTRGTTCPVPVLLFVCVCVVCIYVCMSA